uniref:Cytochrome c-type protein n=1 Tax=Candidatus Kentrum eta TaxID=2126337 RepID=A0A450UTJ1_9GAMM|nr:MAG: cytochrome c-type protein NapC [Candidatus Kentron sp. H]VFJ95806.1 MAG: cytochrome c-type protein NapC [Candidatus Kentron sp. H]VFK01995.1 MAG: cytochrome c-type protein NapC [Candidatus Kentron sp. H]
MANSDTEKGHAILKKVIVFGVVFAAGITFAGTFGYALKLSDQEEFCISCHSMGMVFQEYRESLHYKNASGVSATCSDCHVPKEFWPKIGAKLLAYKDVLHEFLGTIDTREKLDEHRWDMANRVWDRMRATGSRECLACHSFEKMDLSEQDRSARRKHGLAVDQDKSCIDCHQGIVHHLPDEPDVG